MFTKIVLAAAFICNCTAIHAQYNRCGTDSRNFKELLAAQWLKKKPNVSGASAGTDTLFIPVVVHILYHLPEENISDEQVKSQIDILNEDYSGKNGTAATIPDVWANMLTDSKIRFVLAARTAEATPQNSHGITRKQVSVNGFAYNDNSIKYTVAGGTDAWPSDQYLNIWVCNIYNDVLGFAPFPGADPDEDGVVINYKAFGRIGALASKYNYGRTATHEIGHWLNLIHIWGDTPDCNMDDQVQDTPLQADANYCCPKFPHFDDCQPAGNGVMFMNYMDYTDDKFMQFFTPGQITRMNDAINDFRSSLFISDGDQLVQAYSSDLSVEEISTPAITTESRCFSPVVRIRNNGTQPVNGFTVTYQMYEGNARKYKVSNTLIPGEDIWITLPLVSGRNGINIFEVRIVESDNNNVNNYLSRSFNSPDDLVAGCSEGDPFIYPNPVSGSTFCVRSNFSSSGDLVIRLVNTLGQSVYELKTKSNPGDVFTIPMSGQIRGVYFLQMKDKDDNSMSSPLIYFPDGTDLPSSCQ